MCGNVHSISRGVLCGRLGKKKEGFGLHVWCGVQTRNFDCQLHCAHWARSYVS